MKSIYPVLCSLLITAAIGACSDEPTVATGPVAAPAGTVKALLNGASFTSDSGTASSAEYIRSSRLLTIFGTKGGNEELSITIFSLNGAGTYALGGQQSKGLASFAHFDRVDTTLTRTYATNAEKAGTMVLTKFDTVGGVISGTFKFNALQLSPSGTTNTMTVLDGSFTDLPLTLRDSSAARSEWIKD